MVRFLVDVEWNVSWFVVWQVFTVSQVRCDVKKVYYFLIGLDSNLQTVLGENTIQFLLSKLGLPTHALPNLSLML